MTRPTSLLTLLCLLTLAPAARAQGGMLDSVAQVSRGQLGARYRLGAVQPGRRFDCSGLVQYVMSVFHLPLPRTAAEQAKLGVAVPPDTAQLLPGDIRTFGRGRRITHVGIYVGAGRYVHASSRKRTVVEVPLPEPGTRQGRLWKGARRVLETGSATDTDSVPPTPSEPPAS